MYKRKVMAECCSVARKVILFFSLKGKLLKSTAFLTAIHAHTHTVLVTRVSLLSLYTSKSLHPFRCLIFAGHFCNCINIISLSLEKNLGKEQLQSTCSQEHSSFHQEMSKKGILLLSLVKHIFVLLRNI